MKMKFLSACLLALGLASAPALAQGSCFPAKQSLCLRSSRFRVEVDWALPGGIAGKGQAVPLTDDLSASTADPVHLFKASDGPWLAQPPRVTRDERSYPAEGVQMVRTRDGQLLAMWSSHTIEEGYIQAVARSRTGELTGPWEQLGKLVGNESGHGMLLRSFDDQLLLAIQQPFGINARTQLYEIEDAGFKYNMTDIAAALGLVQLSRAEELFASRRALVDAYRELLADASIADLVELPTDEPDGSHAWHLFVIRLHLDRLSIDRSAVIARLKDCGIGTSVHFIPLHLHPYYQRTWGYRPDDLPVAAAEFERVISLPLWPGMAPADVERVVAALEDVLGPARR